MYFDDISPEELKHIMLSRGTSYRLRDIQGAIANIEEYTTKGRKAFDESELVQVWIIYHLMVIGEAIRNLPRTLKNEYAHTPWEKMSDMGDLLIHEYFATDNNNVWLVATQDVPVVKATIDALLQMIVGV